MSIQSKKYKKFIVGAASAALVASAVAPVVSAASFNDTEGNTHELAIDALTKAGVIKGYKDGSFKPNKTLTRSDVVKLMGKWLVTQGKEIPTNARTSMRFSDLSPTSDKELLDYAAVVKDNKVFNGSNGKLMASGNITRENMALVLVRAFDEIEGIDLVSYVAEQDFDKDVIDLTKAKEEARPAIDVLDYFDITNPIAPNFNPKTTTTRGHFATFLHKSINTDFSEVTSEGVDKVAVDAAAKQLKDGAVSLLRGENATNENKLAAVEAYVAGLVTDKDVKATVVVGKTANNYSVTLTKGTAKVEKEIAITFEMTAKDLFVTTVTAINNTGVELTFNATAADNKDANVVVKDGAGNVVPTTSTIVAEGAKIATIKFTKEFAADYKFTGVWTVNGVAFNFDASNQLSAIKAAATAGNQIALQSALDAAGIAVADKARIGEYLTGIKESTKLDSLEAVQELINKIDNDTMGTAAKAAAVKAVVEATTQQQLLNALSANFKAVNGEWIVDYSTTVGLLALNNINQTDFETIQAKVYTVNFGKITTTNDVASNSVEQGKVSSLIDTWMKADGKDETVKKAAFKASKLKESAFKIAEAATPNEISAALINYANLIEDKDNSAQLKEADLNANLKAFYFAKLNKVNLINAIKTGNEVDIKTIFVTAADAAAVTDAMTKISEASKAINTAEAKEEKSTATEKAALKTALQNLATVTSHKKDTAKFDASIVIDANLVAYAAEFAKEASNLTVADVVADINTANKNSEVATGIVSNAAELSAALKNPKLEKITLKNNILITESVTLSKNIVLDGNGKTLLINTPLESTSTAKGLYVPEGSEGVVIKDITITTGTHDDNLIEIYGDATLENVSALGGKKAGIYVNNNGVNTITVNFKNITTAGNGWNAGIGMAAQKTDSKIIANFTGTHSFGEETAVYTDDFTNYLGEYKVNGLNGYTEKVVTNQHKWTKTK